MSVNAKANLTTELEIAFFRLGGLAMVIDSINRNSVTENLMDQTLVQGFIEKAMNIGLAKLVDNQLAICSNGRKESFAGAVCCILLPLQKLIGYKAAATPTNDQSCSTLWNLSLSLG